jgi:hypothetical protein
MAEPAEDADENLRRELDAPRENAELYEARGDEVDDLRPICQGDVFEGLCLPGFEQDDHSLVLLAQHPCSLRKGASLRPRVQAVPVRAYQHIVPSAWASRHLRVFPLPDLDGSRHLAADLSEAGVLKSEQLDSARRVFTLSQRGILLLQQRIVWTAAHTIVGLDTFEEFNAQALAEIELLEFWNEQLCSEQTGPERGAALLATAEEFERYIRAEGLQDALARPSSRADARRMIRKEAVRRAEMQS